jgi:peptidoglycan/LPS O-acetylase OafA/YrhL
MIYRREIDGLRAVAVIPVMLFHGGFGFFSGGFIGVDVFFVISGYLITTIIISEMEEGKFSLVGFYERRARRILPALLFVVLLTIPFAWSLMPPDELRKYFQSVSAVTVFSSNILFWVESGYFDTAAELKPLLHTWSLAVEEQYYLFFPLMVLLTWRYSKRYVLPFFVIVGVISLMLAQWGSINHPTANFFLLPTRFWELMIGSVTAFLLYYKDNLAISIFRSRSISQLLSLVGLLLIGYSIVTFTNRTPFPSLYTLAPTIGTALIILFAADKTIANSFLSNRLFVGIGLISYSAYLWHQPVLAFGRMNHVNDSNVAGITLLLMLSLILAYFSWRFIEKPFRNKNKFTRKIIFKYALGGSAAFLSIGLIGNFGNNIFYNYSPEQMATMSEIDSLSGERQSLIRYDECQFNGRSGKSFDKFISNWDCWDDPASSRYKRIPVVVTGDSHAADLTVALKLNGYLPLHIGGAECSLNPLFMTGQCNRLYGALFDRVKKDSYFKYLVISNRYDKEELSIKSLEETVKFWKKFGLQIIFVTGMPEFSSFKTAALLSTDIEPDFSISDFSERDELTDYLERNGVLIVNRREIYCALTPICSYRDNDGFLLVDYGHLSSLGAMRFGQTLLKDSAIFKSVIEESM